jgi:ribosomal protein S11
MDIQKNDKVKIESLNEKKIIFFFKLMENMKRNKNLFNNKFFVIKSKKFKFFYLYFLANFYKIFKLFYFHKFLRNVIVFDIKSYFDKFYYYFINNLGVKIYDKLNFNVFDEDKTFNTSMLFDFFIYDKILNFFFTIKFNFRIIFTKRDFIKTQEYLFAAIKLKFSTNGDIITFFKEINDNLILIRSKKYEKVYLFRSYLSNELNLYLKFKVMNTLYLKNYLKKNIFLFSFFELQSVFFKTKERLKRLTNKYFKYFIYKKQFNFLYFYEKFVNNVDIIKKKKRLIFKQLQVKRAKKKYSKTYYSKKHKRKFFVHMKPRKAMLHFKPSYSNYFMTMTDLSYNTVVCYSGGRVSLSNNKKTKISTVVAYSLIKSLFFYLKMYKIKQLIFEIKKRMDAFFYQAMSFLKYKRLKVYRLYAIRRLPHNKGLRKRKLRRI